MSVPVADWQFWAVTAAAAVAAIWLFRGVFPWGKRRRRRGRARRATLTISGQAVEAGSSPTRDNIARP